MDTLGTFYMNVAQREAVQGFLLECLREAAIEKVFAMEDTKAIAEAKIVIDQAFDRLSEIYGKIPAPVIESSR